MALMIRLKNLLNLNTLFLDDTILKRTNKLSLIYQRTKKLLLSLTSNDILTYTLS